MFICYYINMSILLLTGNKISDIKNSVIKSIKLNRLDLTCQNIIVVPDRYSLIVEKSVFSELNIKSTFSIRVMGINNLAKSLILNAKLDCVFADGIESDFILYRAIQNVKSKLVCFSKHITLGMVEKVKNALSLLRSSGVECQDLLNTTTDINTQKKLNDLALILQEYEKLLNGKLDATNILKLFSNLIETTSAYKNTNFYFCGFDSFTAQGYEIIKKIAPICKNLTIGVIVKSNYKNSNIYDGEIIKKLSSFFEEKKLEFVQSNLNNSQKIIFENVYGYNLKPQQFLDNYYTILELPSKYQEIEFVAKQICSLTNKGNKFKDIQIATNEKYYSSIEKIFLKYNINFYIDDQKSLGATPLANFVNYALMLGIFNLDKENLINFINNYFVQIDLEIKNDIENFIIENNIEYSKVSKLIEQFNEPQLNYIINFANNLNSQNKLKEYVKQIEQLFLDYNISQQIENLCQNFNKNNDLKNEKIYLQILDKIYNLNQKLIDVIGEEEISLTDFYELYTNAITSIKISQVPLNLDCVFVGDACKSFYEKSKYMFIVGANQDVIPTQIKDLGLISDNEIEDLSKKISISPTAKVINKRNKFKVFDLLTEAQKLFITYSIADEEGKKLLPSSFVSDLLILNNNQKLNQEYFSYLAEGNNLEKLKFNNPNIKVALNNIKSDKYGATIKNVLQGLNIEVDYTPANKESIQFGADLIKNNTTKISQIESYYTCPFRHFLNYGLKLIERKDGQIKPNDFGNFLHEFCKIFVDNAKCLGSLTIQQLDFLVNKTFEKLTNNKYKILNEPENNLTKKILYDEVKRFAEFINFEQSVSAFKVFKTEYKFENENALKVEVNNNQYSIVGIVDRIDKYDNNLRVIDYKTGSSASSNASISNLYYGTKIQVYVYLKATTELFNAKPFGAFYLPISNAFSDEKADEYKLQGYFIDDVNLCLKADNTITFENPKSRFFDASILVGQKNIQKNIYKLAQKQYKKNISIKELYNMMEYSVKIVENGIKEIISGNTKISPLKDSCKFCEGASVCGVGKDCCERQKSKITTKTFLGEEDEWFW